VVVARTTTGSIVACGQGAVRLVEVQPEGKARMDGAAFANGYRPDPGETLGTLSGPSPSVPTGEGQGLAARRAALVALRAVDEDGAWSNLAVPAAIDASRTSVTGPSPPTSPTTRCGGRGPSTGCWQVLTRPLDGVEPALRRVLRLGALQLLRTGVPARAAVATSVSLSREQVPAGRAKGAGGFVNGVLRNLARRMDDLPWPDEEVDPVGHLALRTGHPPWIVSDLLGRLGPERTRAVLDADDEPPG
jgi:16S rRNA (cytosine967-C5)-methyltransferase